MRIRLLGTAAGGGVPQWNCNCQVCGEARATHGQVTPRTQSCVAISADDRHWFLLNASPDLRAQIESFPPLHPPGEAVRGTPIQAVLLTNADLDHTLGLMLLREGQMLRVHAPRAVQNSLRSGLAIDRVLSAFGGIEWVDSAEKPSPLLLANGTTSGLTYETVPLLGNAPRFMREEAAAPGPHVVGYRITDERTGGRLLFLPDVSAVDERLRRIMTQCDALLFDGTFWSEREMESRGTGSHTASFMGHLPISGDGGSLKLLAELAVQPKVYAHINNTNPILINGSAEAAAVEAAGCLIGCDGMEIKI
jgi:pyrroloquinoline quinone biosynthesis protein B